MGDAAPFDATGVDTPADGSGAPATGPVGSIAAATLDETPGGDGGLMDVMPGQEPEARARRDVARR